MGSLCYMRGTDRWVSGLNQWIANPPSSSRGSEGSNPSLSATLEHKCERRSPPYPRHLKTSQPQKLILRAHDADLVLTDLDSLRERPQMVAPKSAVLSTHAAAGDGGESRQLRWREALIG